MAEIEKAFEEMANIIGDALPVSSHYGELGFLTEAKYDLGKDIASLLYRIGYRKQSDTMKEFAEKLKAELFVNCIIIQNISNPQKEDMDSSEAFQIINEVAASFGGEDNDGQR